MSSQPPFFRSQSGNNRPQRPLHTVAAQADAGGTPVAEVRQKYYGPLGGGVHFPHSLDPFPATLDGWLSDPQMRGILAAVNGAWSRGLWPWRIASLMLAAVGIAGLVIGILTFVIPAAKHSKLLGGIGLATLIITIVGNVKIGQLSKGAFPKTVANMESELAAGFSRVGTGVKGELEESPADRFGSVLKYLSARVGLLKTYKIVITLPSPV